MYCGNCFRDNALVTEFRRSGHDALMVPLYLPLTLDEANQAEGTPIFFGGLNVYLSQKFKLFRRTPVGFASCSMPASSCVALAGWPARHAWRGRRRTDPLDAPR